MTQSHDNGTEKRHFTCFFSFAPLRHLTAEIIGDVAMLSGYVHPVGLVSNKYNTKALTNLIDAGTLQIVE